MKDTVLTARRKKIEIITLLVCFVLANLVNLYAIITYHRSMMEMITSILYSMPHGRFCASFSME